MKNLIIFIALCIPLTAANSPAEQINYTIKLPIIKPGLLTHAEIIQAIIYVESRGNDSARCISEDAIGALQIRRTMVRDVNRILKRQGSTERYKLKDRWNRQLSIEMFNIYCAHYKLVTPEAKARCWNGGPRGIRKSSTLRYWEKVKRKLAS
jgi:hypothetical protein